MAQRIDASGQLRQIERRAGVFQTVLSVLLLIVIVLAGISWWLQRQEPQISRLEISNMRVVGDAMLCPGNILQIEYDLYAEGAGLIFFDATVWRIAEPPKTIVFSDSRRAILVDTIDQRESEAWEVPKIFVDPATAQATPLLPGEYVRHIAISSQSRGAPFALGSVAFSVKDCQS